MAKVTNEFHQIGNSISQINIDRLRNAFSALADIWMYFFMFMLLVFSSTALLFYFFFVTRAHLTLSTRVQSKCKHQQQQQTPTAKTYGFLTQIYIKQKPRNT